MKTESQEAIPASPTQKSSGSKVIKFKELAPSYTGVNFVNLLQDKEDMNIFSFEYMYNGGGVAVGDINNDGLTDIYFSSNQGPNRLYLNKGQLKFQDITAQAGVDAKGRFKTGVAMVDLNQDGLLDLMALKTGMGDLDDRINLVYINNGNGTFTESSKKLGLNQPDNTIHCNFIDYDSDGDLDVFYGNHPIDRATNNQYRVRRKGSIYEINNNSTNSQEANKLYRNDGNKFVEVGKSLNIVKRGFALSSVVSDFNQDGKLDLYIGNDYIDPDLLYINQKNGFVDMHQKFFKTMSQNTMGSDYEDINNDGLYDLVTLDMLPGTRQRQNKLFLNMNRDYFDQGVEYGYGSQIIKNMLHVNIGKGKYSEQSNLANINATDWSWASVLIDFDNDGFKDLYISNGYKRDVTDLDFMDFRDQNLSTGFKAKNINEFLKVIPEVRVENKLYRNLGNGTFEDQTKSSGVGKSSFSHGVAYADLDNDGDLDLIVNNLNEPASIFRNLTRENSLEGTNYLTVKLLGPELNRFGVNATVELTIGDQIIKQEYRPMKGYMSCVENKLLFGVGSAQKIDKIKITWPDGKTQIINDAPVNGEMAIEYKFAKAGQNITNNPSPLYTINKQSGINYTHKGPEYNDFKREPLLMYKLSEIGPALATSDINGDGLKDFYIGGGAGQAAKLYIQNANGTFRPKSVNIFSEDAKYEDIDALFFDLDEDGDEDLYVVSGGYELDDQNDLHMDRFYENDGSGNFTNSSKFNVTGNENGSTVAAGDYDGDGDLDLFIGARVVAGRFPEFGDSKILENDNGILKELSKDKVARITNCGMVTDAVWTDLDGDKTQELIVVGEWMKVSVFSYDGTNFKDKTNDYGLGKSFGLWQSLELADIDGDGDRDLIVGNLGLNTRFHATENRPMTCYEKDFDDNGSIDPILCMYSQGKNYPIPRKSLLTQELPMLKKRFLKNADYAVTQVNGLFEGDLLSSAKMHMVTTLETSVFTFDGNKFNRKALPLPAQAFPTKAISYDEENKELFLAGNIEGMEVENGPYNSGYGLYLKFNGNGFETFSNLDSGIEIPFETNAIELLNSKNGKLLVVANHDGPTQVFSKK